jgi:hypothetical protein
MDKSSEKYKARRRIISQKSSLKTKLQAFEAYGGCTCVCCGESHHMMLSLDHVENDGAQHRRGSPANQHNLARWVKAQGYPPGFQVLCYNCNIGKHRNNGVCPHEQY